MEIKKINVDRKPLETEYIQSKQDFQHVLANYKKAHIPVFKQPLFYGVIGFASLATLITVSVFNINPEQNDKIITSKNEAKVSTIEKPDPIQKSNLKFSVKPATMELAKIDRSKQIKVKEKSVSTQETKGIHTQIVTQPEKKVKPTPSNFPHISGISEGAISISQLCNSEGILMRNGLDIVAFKFQYISGGTDKLITVSGNKIPSTVCAEMTKSNLEQLVFITDIEANSANGKVDVPSMNLWVSNKG